MNMMSQINITRNKFFHKYSMEISIQAGMMLRLIIFIEIMIAFTKVVMKVSKK